MPYSVMLRNKREGRVELGRLAIYFLGADGASVYNGSWLVIVLVS